MKNTIDLTGCSEETKQKFLALTEEEKELVFENYEEAISQSGDPNYMDFAEYLEENVDFV